MSSAAGVTLGPPPSSLGERLAQLVMIRVGSNLPPICTVKDDEERVARLLDASPVGGLLLFNGGTEAKAVLERLQRRSNVPLLVGADIERGVGQQVKGYTLFPHAMAFEKLGNERSNAVAAFAKVLARETREVGIHVTFGPVADVNINPKNPIIATRAFSEATATAIELTRAYVEAAEGAGLCTTAKHFPGHGATHQDSHDSLPTVSRSLEELQACELPPFQAAIDAGCSLIMTAHVAYSALDSSGVPATLSPTILQHWLRERMGFRGVVCSDSLLMAGVRHQFETEEEMSLAAFAAGVDLLLDVEDPVRVVDYLCRCVESGSLSAGRVDEAFERVWELKRKVFEGGGAELTPSGDTMSAGADLAERIARGAIEWIGNGSPALPLKRDLPLTAILLKPFETPLDPPEQPLAAALRERFRSIRYLQLGPNADEGAYDQARQLAANAQQLLLAVIVRPAAWHAFGLRHEQGEFVQQMTASRPAVLASLGVPYVLHDYPQAAARICTYSDVPASQQVLADFLSSTELRP